MNIRFPGDLRVAEMQRRFPRAVEFLGDFDTMVQVMEKEFRAELHTPGAHMTPRGGIPMGSLVCVAYTRPISLVVPSVVTSRALATYGYQAVQFITMEMTPIFLKMLEEAFEKPESAPRSLARLTPQGKVPAHREYALRTQRAVLTHLMEVITK